MGECPHSWSPLVGLSPWSRFSELSFHGGTLTTACNHHQVCRNLHSEKSGVFLFSKLRRETVCVSAPYYAEQRIGSFCESVYTVLVWPTEPTVINLKVVNSQQMRQWSVSVFDCQWDKQAMQSSWLSTLRILINSVVTYIASLLCNLTPSWGCNLITVLLWLVQVIIFWHGWGLHCVYCYSMIVWVLLFNKLALGGK